MCCASAALAALASGALLLLHRAAASIRRELSSLAQPLSGLHLRRRHQYTSITDWTGGLYISPGFAGSRSGALIATAWAALVHHGEEGYLKATGGGQGCAGGPGRACLVWWVLPLVQLRVREGARLRCQPGGPASRSIHPVHEQTRSSLPALGATSHKLLCRLRRRADAMMKAAQQFLAGVRAIQGIEVVGEPEMCVVAFKASRGCGRRGGEPVGRWACRAAWGAG